MDNYSNYKIEKARHMMYRRGQFSELRGFDAAVRLFASGDDGLRAELEVKKEAKADDNPSFWKKHKGKILGSAAALAALAAGIGLAAHAGREMEPVVAKRREHSDEYITTNTNSVSRLLEVNNLETAFKVLRNTVEQCEESPYFLTADGIARLKTAADILKTQIVEEGDQEAKMTLLPMVKVLVSKINKFTPAKATSYATVAGENLRQDYEYAKGKASSLYNKAKKMFE
jgi:hypothetical protein